MRGLFGLSFPRHKLLNVSGEDAGDEQRPSALRRGALLPTLDVASQLGGSVVRP